MKKSNQKFLSLVLTAALTFSVVGGINWANVKAQQNSSKKTAVNASTLSQKYSAKDNANWLKSKYGKDFVPNENQPITVNPNEVIRVIVQLKDKPTLEFGTKGLASIKSTQSIVKSKVKSLEGAKIRNTYTDVVNGFSMTVKRSEINKIKAIPEVKSVTEAKMYYPDMTSAKSLTQAYDTWKDYGYKGKGMVVSIIDSGIDWTHKDMKITDPSQEKIKTKTPEGPGKYYSDKVPYGYNFAELNSNIIDTGDMHGMHVAGIVGANGSADEVSKNKAIQGVAPECQLLAMKVFANDPNIGGAYSDDIVAAIEDSVKHGADVINMSLGSNCGFQDSEEPEAKAIKNATDKGVMVVVSAGNSQYNTAPYKISGLYDTGDIGSPGITKDTLQVASYENTKIQLFNLDYTSTSGNGSFTYEVNNVNPKDVLKGDVELVECGLGQVSDFTGKDLNGKMAIVSRGTITFAEKEVNAQKAGAKGIIIYNNLNADGTDRGYIGGMVVDPTVTIPVIGMLHADGTALIAKISDGLKVQYNGKLTPVDNPNANDMASSTSWGPAPSLDFKPEISAPGGNIWSTVNSNQYENMSGTSMASPHTAGSEALILQALKSKNLGITGRDLVDLAKTTTINTAKTIMDKFHNTVPYSPRRQGAGLVQIEDAVKNSVSIKDDNGNAAVALKEIGKTKTFTLNLKNYSDTPATYTLSDIGGVLTEQSKTINTMSYDKKIAGATITYNNNTVTVPAKGTATVNVTITLPEAFATEQFVEGYVKFTSNSTAINPSLVVPYIGFYGDWSKEDNIDAPNYDSDNSYFGYTKILSLGSDNNSLYYLGYIGDDEDGNPIIDKDKIAISPNGDGNNDNVYPFLSLLRNAKTIKIQVLDKDGKIINQFATANNVRKAVFADTRSNPYEQSMDWMWKGTAYDNASKSLKTVPDGQYYIDYVTKIDMPNATEKHLKVPVKVDTVAPTIDVLSSASASSKDYKLQWKVNDSLSGDEGVAVVYLNGVKQKLAVNIDDNGVYSCNLVLSENKLNSITIGASDYAANIASKTFNVKEGNVPFNLTFNNLSSRMTVDKSNLTVTGSVSYTPSVFKINGKDVTIKDDMTFSTDLTFKEGRNIVSVYVVDIDGKTVLKDFSYKVDCDTVAPLIEVTSPTIYNDSTVYTNTNSIKLVGKVSDNTFGYKFYINGDQKFMVSLDGESGSAATERTFSYDLPVTNNSSIELKAVDLFGHETIKNINVVIDTEKPVITVTGVEEGKVYENKVTPVIKCNDANATISTTLNGVAYNGKEIVNVGSYKLVITATDRAGNVTIKTINFSVKAVSNSSNSQVTTAKKLVQTGSMVDTNLLLVLGTIFMVCGAAFVWKRKREVK